MDPHILIEQPGMQPQDGQTADDPAEYLRRLKTQSGDSCSVTAAITAPQQQERRRSLRFQCTGSVEFRAEGADSHMWGTLKDISLHGCYIEMAATFPVNTRVSLLLDSAGVKVSAPAMVRASYPSLGMGLCFSGMDASQQLQLHRLLSALAKEKAIRNGVAPAEARALEDITVADPQACMAEIKEFFQKNSELSRDEFYQIAKRARRS